MTSLTTPRDAISGLTERLRALAPNPDDYMPLTRQAMLEAATQLDAQAARVKELEAERGEFGGLIEQMTAEVFKACEGFKSAESRALRAEQERDEALERAAGVVDRAIAEFDDLLKRDDVKSAPKAVECTRITMKAFGELAAAIRRLASGPEKEKRE